VEIMPNVDPVAAFVLLLILGVVFLFVEAAW
jgi:hypothetical protein